MSSPRRRVLRPVPPVVPDPQDVQRLNVWRTKLEMERKNFDRWLSRLKRAFHAVEKQQQRITRLERLIANGN